MPYSAGAEFGQSARRAPKTPSGAQSPVASGAFPGHAGPALQLLNEAPTPSALVQAYQQHAAASGHPEVSPPQFRSSAVDGCSVGDRLGIAVGLELVGAVVGAGVAGGRDGRRVGGGVGVGGWVGGLQASGT